MVREALLACGIISLLLYVAMNIFVPMSYQGYSFASQTVSEFSAIDAPTRPLWLALGIAYTSLVAAFGLGVWKSANRSRPLHALGRLLVASGIIGGPADPASQRVSWERRAVASRSGGRRPRETKLAGVNWR